MVEFEYHLFIIQEGEIIMIDLRQLKDKILILDGGIGTALESYNVEKTNYNDLNFCNEMFNITKPEIVRDMHEKYILAGADIIETNTFNCNTLTLGNINDKKIEKEVYRICKKGCELALKVKEEFLPRKVYVAGSIGPTFMSMSMVSKNKFQAEREKLKKIYFNQMEAILDTSIDFLLLETVFDKINLEVALETYTEIKAEKVIDIPIIISFAVGENGKIYSGENIEDIIKDIDCESVIGYGFNCCKIGDNLINQLEKLNKTTSKLIICYPNAGTPDEKGVYPISLNMMKDFYAQIIEKKLVNIVGGCCGTNWKEIEVLKKLLKDNF